MIKVMHIFILSLLICGPLGAKNKVKTNKVKSVKEFIKKDVFRKNKKVLPLKLNGINAEFLNLNMLDTEAEYKAPDFASEDQKNNEEAIIKNYKIKNKRTGPLPKIELIVDSSGSMGQLLGGNKTKMFYSKKVISKYLIDQWKENAQVGMRVYGSRQKKQL